MDSNHHVRRRYADTDLQIDLSALATRLSQCDIVHRQQPPSTSATIVESAEQRPTRNPTHSCQIPTPRRRHAGIIKVPSVESTSPASIVDIHSWTSLDANQDVDFRGVYQAELGVEISQQHSPFRGNIISLAPSSMYTRPHLQAVPARASTLQPSLSLLEQDTPQLVTAGEPPYTILDVNEAWLQVCEFSRDEVVGQTLRLLQGPRTELDIVARLMHACARHQAISVKLTNYTKRGEAFTNNLDVQPIADPVSGRSLFRVTTIVEPSVAVDSDVAMDAASIQRNARLCRLLRLRRTAVYVTE